MGQLSTGLLANNAHPLANEFLQALADSTQNSKFIGIGQDVHFSYSKKLFEAAEGNSYYQCFAQKELTYHYIKTHQLEKALKLSKEVQEKAVQLESDEMLMNSYIAQSMVYLKQFDYFLAIQSLEKSIVIGEKIDVDKDAIGPNHQLGRIYYSCQLYNQSLINFEKCRPAHKDTVKNRYPWWHLDIGKVYLAKEEFELAEEHFLQAKELAIRKKNKRCENSSYLFLAEAYRSQGKKIAVSAYEKAIKSMDEQMDKVELFQAYSGLGQYYYKENKLDSAANYFNKVFGAIEVGNMEDKLIPALDFFIKYPKYQPLVKKTNQDLFTLRINAAEKLFEKKNSDNLKRAEVMNKLVEAEKNERSALDKSNLKDKIIFLVGVLVLTVSFFLSFLYQKNLKLSKSQAQINEQYEVIKRQTKTLAELNEKLSVSNTSLKKDLSIHSLELGHSKQVIQDIQKATQEKEVQSIESILRTQVQGSYFEGKRAVNQLMDKQFIFQITTTFPSLSFMETELCCLLRNGLNTKEIANITRKSIPSIKVARSRIRKKMEIPKSTEISIFLNKLDFIFKPDLKKN